MWAMRGSVMADEDSASVTADSAVPTSAGPWVSARPTRAGRPGMADKAPAATTAAEPPFKNMRRLTSLIGTSWARVELHADHFIRICVSMPPPPPDDRNPRFLRPVGQGPTGG